MPSSLARVAVGMLVAAALGACSSGSPLPAGSLAGEPRPVALDMQLEQVTCQSGVQATACFTVTITNRGSASGGGSCQLFGEIHRTSYPGDESEGGQVFEVEALAPGQTLTTSGSWQGTARDSYRGICSPGLGS